MFDPATALQTLSAVQPTAPPAGWPAGAPHRDYLRSAAAIRVGHLAAAEQLFSFHFEHRFPLDLPDSWVAAGAEQDASPPTWVDGCLPERKYQSFRHDLIVGSFHPAHRGKWTTHELCHALVGFAWHPGASPLFNATAARLAELLPVALYYFLDEVRLTRCPIHAGGGALFHRQCADCEQLAALRPAEPSDLDALRSAARYLEDELAAVAKTRRLGRPVSHRFATLDLCSDGLAYARAHARRLDSQAMERLHPFLQRAGGCWPSLEALEHRVEQVVRALCLGEPLAPLGGSRAHWAEADLAFRLLTVWEETEGEAATAVLGLIDQLWNGGDVREAWEQLEQDFVLPTATQVFAVGYGGASSIGQLREGLRSVVPLTLELAEDVHIDLAEAFAPADPSVRLPLGDRFVSWLREAHPALAELASFEVAIRSVRTDPLGALGPGFDPVPCTGSRVLLGSVNLVALSEGVDSGSVSARLVGTRVEHTLEPHPSGWAIGRAPDGDLILVELDPDDARSLIAGNADAALAEQLCELGVMRASRW